jgi:hypothetical protein
MSRALALTDNQLRLVQSAARQVPVNHRQDFLVGIADDLMRHEPITDADVASATQRMCARFISGAP